MRRSLFLMFLLAHPCSTQKPEEIVSQSPDHSFCEFYVEGICVMGYGNNLDIDPETLSKYLGFMEYEVNYYYPGLDFDFLAENSGLDLLYRWANNTIGCRKGIYDDLETLVTVWLRRGENITLKMRHTDRYFITVHEMLHFIVKRHIYYDDSSDAHDVPNIFERWAELRNVSSDLTVEGRMYSIIARDGFALQE